MMIPTDDGPKTFATDWKSMSTDGRCPLTCGPEESTAVGRPAGPETVR